LTSQVKDLIRLASAEAARLNHEFIGSEHILLALVKQTSGPAFEILGNLGVDPHQVRLQLEGLVPPGPQYDTGGSTPGPQTKRMLDCAIEEACNLQHAHVGTEHVLLGLLREPGTTGEVVLNFFGLTLKRTRREVRRLFPPSRADERKNDPSDDLSSLPEDVKQTVAEMSAQVEQLNEEKEQAVADQDFEKAAHLRDRADKIKKQRAAIIRRRDELQQ
jgi:ATP-dependent Clp protease ATP-binding subunit ClpC